MFIFRATVSAVSCLFVPAFICIDLLFTCALKLNDDDDDDDLGYRVLSYIYFVQTCLCSVFYKAVPSVIQ